ncbi:MAG: haloacid dehalogenase type II [Oscillochloris sp.]|nr:haloacid dehalogenase type II [Oscillochloris sp.]
MINPAGIVFDAYGTLLDVTSTATICEARFPGFGSALSDLWRRRQLEYSWLRSLMGRHVDFSRVTADALDFALAALELKPSEDDRTALLRSYLTLAPFPEVPAALAQLSAFRRLVLSNGSEAMLEPALTYAGVRDQLQAVLSVERVGVFKPAPQVYALAVVHLGCAPHEALFVSSNGWDIAGAAAFGLHTCWLNRSGAPLEQLGVQPEMVVADLAELVGMLVTDDA